MGQQAKVLRVGVIQGGKILEERVLPARQAVTIGSAPNNTIAVPGTNLPASLQIFTWQGDRYALCFDKRMEGRIQGPQGQADFGALVSQGLARQQGQSYAVPINEDQHGKIVVGEITLLWQFVTPPPEAPKAVLPREATGNHFRSMDRLFVTVLVVSLLLHTGTYIALANAEVPAEVTLEEIPDRYAKVLIPEKIPQPVEVKKEEARKQEAVAEKAPEEKKPEATEKKAENAEQAASRKAAHQAAIAKAVQSKGILKVLGALGPGTGQGAVADVFGAGGGAGDVASALAGAGGVAVATDPGAGGGRKGGGQGSAASIGTLATSGGGGSKVAYGAKTDVRVSGSVATEEAEIDSSDIDQSKLAAFIRARMGLLKACYENALKRNPTLKGKISIRFTILETGGLADITAAVNSLGSSEVASCIVSTMRGWRTQFRPSGPVTVEYPFLFSPAN
jgi:outer membrane biosynthesis protein TonB